MNNLQKQRDEGFTIIEVVLVLAIAALIMLMVFIALPALQRNQRDTTRKNDISRLQSEVNNYKSRNRGALPTGATGWTGLVDDLKTRDDFADPAGGAYTINYQTSGSSNAAPSYTDDNAGRIYVKQGAKCNGEDPTGSINTSSRRAALVISLEGGGSYCAEV